jgi:hypothetical protein
MILLSADIDVGNRAGGWNRNRNRDSREDVDIFEIRRQATTEILEVRPIWIISLT